MVDLKKEWDTSNYMARRIAAAHKKKAGIPSQSDPRFNPPRRAGEFGETPGVGATNAAAVAEAPRAPLVAEPASARITPMIASSATPAAVVAPLPEGFTRTNRLPGQAESMRASAPVIPRTEDAQGNFMQAPARNYGQDLPVEDYAAEALIRSGAVPAGSRFDKVDMGRVASPLGISAGLMGQANKNIAEGRRGQGSFNVMPEGWAKGAADVAAIENASLDRRIAMQRAHEGPGSKEVARTSTPVTDPYSRRLALRNAGVGLDTVSRRHESKGARKSRELSNATKLAGIADLRNQYAAEDERGTAMQVARMQNQGRADPQDKFQLAMLNAGLREQGAQAGDQRAEAREVSRSERAAELDRETRKAEVAQASDEALLGGDPGMRGLYNKLITTYGPAEARELLNEAATTDNPLTALQKAWEMLQAPGSTG